jgi:hypothetical protein
MNPVSDALDRLVTAISIEGVANVTRDPSKFHPAPVGVIVGAPTITGFTLSAVTFTTAVLVVATETLTAATLDRILTVVLQVCEAVQVPEARPSSWSGGPNLEPLPAYEITATVTTPNL